MRQLASWMVTYADGSVLHQTDEQSPKYLGAPGTGEVPMNAIEWDRAKELHLESQWAKSVFRVVDPGPGLQTSLRRRTFSVLNSGIHATIMLVVTSEAGQEVDDNSVRHVTYWCPDGTVHDCHLFNCPDVANYVIKGQPLMPHTAATNSQADALLA